VSEGRIDREIAVDGGLIWERGGVHAVDVVGELSCWRRERKRAFEYKERFGRRDGVEIALVGHWRGEIKVVKEVLHYG